MKFGKLADISNVDFQLPDDPAETAAVLRRSGAVGAPLQVYIGGTGWSTKEWVGKVYPPGTPAKGYLRAYTRQFNTIELNTTHYRIPSPGIVERWYGESAADFRFCPKIPQSISHRRDLGLNDSQIEQFVGAIARLKEKLGCCFIQLPPFFGYERLELLERFIQRWPTDVPLAVELRHESWFADASRQHRTFGMLADHGIAAVITDVAGRRDVLHMQVTNALTMVRFVGNGLDPSDYRRIDDWVMRLRTWRDQGLSRAYFFTHEPDNILAPELAVYLLEQLKKHDGIVVRGPRLLDVEGEAQMRLF